MDAELIAALDLAPFQKGFVWLVGAGPGDPGLITVAGTDMRLGEADFILYDALADERLLGLARKGAGLIFAGKRAGVTSCKQSDISNLLIDLARKGNRVLRLKGGDPFTFGRGGEEAGALAKARVPFRIVPGITAGIGGLSYAGIPVTHRDTNHAVTFITGHGADGNLPRLDWQAIGKGSETLVFYMARKHAGEIAKALMAGGRRPDEPAAIVANAARANQSVIVTTLEKLGAAAAASPSISIIVIGENVKLRAELDWLARKASQFSPA